ncbi:type VII secretion protein EccC [[Actinomadura] parvosata subsp. kistnae]|uniref:Type VII secretion protein EccC n=1 Tax=[Actinomadura] parvosata subsp. kistnae TaxID=1909395 RepID=A0A1V0AKV3_9ACTN|nr:type VII secretion protein EccCa [Nonomuraea sp. ATCC 55076]AQZ70810.1 type VII secretion protein EccC [Nonomuraea sp. ATCC 55076]
MSLIVVGRPERRRPPEPPGGEVLLESPPEIPETVTGGGLTQLLTYLPMIAGAGAMALMFTGGSTGNPIMLVSSGLFAISMVGMSVGQMMRNAGERKNELNGRRRDYYRYLEQVRKRVRQAAAQQHCAMTWSHPDPTALWSLVMTTRLWERRPRDDDFAQVRIATSAQRLALPMIPPETRPVEDLDPMTAGALRRFVRTHATVPGLPVALALHSFARIVLTGDPAAARDLVRAALAQAAALHSPEDLRISVCAGGERAAEWEPVKWLPHALHPEEEDGAGPVRLITGDLGELDELLGFELKDRPRFSKGLSDVVPYHVVVVDGGTVPAGSQLGLDVIEGVTVIDLSGATPQAPAQLTLRLEVTPGELVRVAQDELGKEVRTVLGRPDRMAPAAFAALARQLAPLRPPTAGGGAESQDVFATNTTLTDLLRLGDPRQLSPRLTWQPRPVRNRLRVPIGLGADGRPVELDIKEAAQGGMGPHGLVVGATGSGKSELLRTLVLALAITHSSEVLNFVLVDFKGGATFLGLDALPHVSAVITNLEDELPLVDRMHDALHGELVRRQELLRAAGNYASLRDYEQAREQGAALEPLPTLFIVLDEFSELLSAKPEFIELFVMIGRLGRSLGVHLLLASQRLEAGRLRGLDTHLSYRIGLRTFSAAESRAVLGVADAYALPPEPGNAYLMFETTGMTRFKAAYVSGPYRPRQQQHTPAAPKSHRGKIVWYGAERVPAPPAVEAPPVADDPGRQDTLLDIVVERLAGQGPEAHRIWLPPLKEPASLDRLLPRIEATPAHGLTAAGTAPERPGRLHAVAGIVDSPFDQRRDPYWLDLSGAAGNVAIVGAPQTGKSTLLRTLIASLALTHTPKEVQFYCLDFGGGTLSALSGLPHVGGVAARLDADAVRRTVAEVRGVLERRERLFVERGIDSMATYRRMVASGAYEGDGWGDVFLVVDGWSVLRQEYEQLEGDLGDLVTRGLGFGVHVVGTANRWMEFRTGVRDLLGTRLELRLGDAFDSEIDRRAAANVPERAPGRGLTRESLHFLAALPRIDGRSTVDDLADGVAALVEAARAAWHDHPAPPVRLLPALLPAHTLPAPPPDGTRVPIGIDEAALAPVLLDFDADPHFVVFGDTESGKSNLLKVIARGIADGRTPAQARFVVIDYRRSLLDATDTPHRIGYAASSTAATTLLKGVHEVMQERLPPPDLTSEQLRTRSWWTGQDLYVIVDDYDLVATSANPLAVLGDLLPQARDIGLHLVLARAMGGAGRSMMDPVVRRLKEMSTPALLLSGPRDEGQLFGNVRPRQLPPGRGIHVDRRSGEKLVQTAFAG